MAKGFETNAIVIKGSMRGRSEMELQISEISSWKNVSAPDGLD